jgi:hypothetical protein
MARFVLRDGQQLKTFAPAQYRGDGIAGEGIIKDLSLRGSYIMGNVPVSVGWRSPYKFLCRETWSYC